MEHVSREYKEEPDTSRALFLRYTHVFRRIAVKSKANMPLDVIEARLGFEETDFGASIVMTEDVSLSGR